MKKRFLLLYVILVEIFFCFCSYSQEPTLEWVSRFQNIPYSFSLTSDDAQNIFVSGAYFNRLVNKTEFLTLKYNTANGVLQWYRLYKGPDTLTFGFTDIALINIADGCGNVYVGGNSSNNSFGDDIVIIKYNSAGDRIWLARYQGETNDLIAGMVKDKFDNIYITGSGYGLPNTGKDYITIKYDSSGNKLWERTYNNFFNSPDIAKAIAIDSSQNVYVTGYCINANLFEEYVTVKYNNSGIQQWVAKYSTNYNSEAVSLAVDLNKNIYVTGFVDYTNTEFENYLTIKYDSLGNRVWLVEYNSVYPAESSDIPYKILLDNSNNVYISGSSAVKYNETGDFQWADTNSPGKYPALDIDGKFYVTGQKSDINQYWWIESAKYDYNGNKEWTLTYCRRPDTIAAPSDILVDKNYNIYISGNVYVAEQQDKDSILLFKYSQALGVFNNHNQFPGKFCLYQNYPNPFNPQTVISYYLPVNSNVNIKVYDIAGKEVMTLINLNQNAGTYKIVFDGKGFCSGVYFFTLAVDGDILDFKKMVLLK